MVRQLGLFLLFLMIGLIIFVVFSHFRPILPDGTDLPARVGFTLIFLASAWLARRRKVPEANWRLFFACFVASFALLVDRYLPLSEWGLGILNLDPTSPAGLAFDKLESSLLIVTSIVLLTIASGGSLGSIYLRKGDIKRGLTVGLIALILVGAISIPLAEWMFGASGLSLPGVLPWIPAILLFIIGNALNEELLFRGLFLGKLEPFLGARGANLLIAIVFTLHHTGVEYSPDVFFFMLFLFPLALAWGYLMQKTDSLWGSVVFHAAMDIPVVLSLFSTLS
jgi:membrane protease YdiL (CAAX protease family)